jgi:hypothetical protein
MSRNLEYGDRGEDVREAQETLASLGYSEVGQPDGGYFEHTQAAVHRFQSDHGLPATGQLDEHTRAALEEAHVASMNAAVEHSRQGYPSPMDDPHAPWHQRDQPQDGYTRVWFDHENFFDYSDADFATLYVDYATGFQIPVNPWAPQEIDKEMLTLHYANGLRYSVLLADIGTGSPTDRYTMKDGLIVPCDGHLAVSYTRSHVPHLYLLREHIHATIRRVIQERLEIAYVVAAFADIIGINSSGGDPDLYDKVTGKAREAAELHRNR